MSKYYMNILVLYVISSLGVILAQNDGQSCTHDLTSGVCRPLTSCASAQQLIRSGSSPTFCMTTDGQTSTIPMVCCLPEDDTASNQNIKKKGNEGGCDNLTPLGSGIDVAENKCIEYSHLVCEWITAPVLTTGSNKIAVNRCGHTAVPLVVGGTIAQPREFPHMARLGFGSEPDIAWGCGGTLISDEFVLTAAHCVYDRNYGIVNFVRLGDTDFSTTDDDDSLQQFGIAERIRHPSYRPNSKYYDIALIKLDKKAILSKDIIPACLPKQSEIEQSKAIATGWGDTEEDGNSSLVLLKVVLEFFSDSLCTNTFKINRELSTGINASTQICAGSHSEEKDTCQGDSGGPLQVYRTVPYCMYDILGVTSFGKGCGVPGRPAVYTRVSSVRDWIVSRVWND